MIIFISPPHVYDQSAHLIARLAATHEPALVGGQHLRHRLQVQSLDLEAGRVRGQVLHLLLQEGQDGRLKVVELLVLAEDEVEDDEVEGVDHGDIQPADSFLVGAVTQGAGEGPEPGVWRPSVTEGDLTQIIA